MDSSQHNTLYQRTLQVAFWEGMKAEVDLDDVSRNAIPVKGMSYPFPLRCLEIFSEPSNWPHNRPPAIRSLLAHSDITAYSWRDIERTFLPHIPEVPVALGENVAQPPYCWRDADPRQLCFNFAYNTNALYRILHNLSTLGKLPKEAVEPLLDHACQLLCQLYKAENNFLLRNINNNLNMFLISKVVEFLLGKERYDSEQQEPELTQRSLAAALAMTPAYAHLPLVERMGIALAKGVTFIESRLAGGELRKAGVAHVQDVSHQYFARPLALDHRESLLAMISNVGLRNGSFLLAVILDDTTETVDDLAWLLDLMQQYSFLKVHVLVNAAQISVNFSSPMLAEVLHAESFRGLAARLGSQFLVTEMYCPLISFQTNYLPPVARRVIDAADAVFIKGANFFETCQILHKDTFHAFVVFGPISRTLTGLEDYQAAFVHLPAGTPGYIYSPQAYRTVTLARIVARRDGENAENSRALPIGETRNE